MALTQVSITYGGKQLDCELSYIAPSLRSRPPFNPDDYDFTLWEVSVVCTVSVPTHIIPRSITHIEPITSLIQDTPIWEAIEERAINAIMERDYV